MREDGMADLAKHLYGVCHLCPSSANSKQAHTLERRLHAWHGATTSPFGNMNNACPCRWPDRLRLLSSGQVRPMSWWSRTWQLEGWTSPSWTMSSTSTSLPSPSYMCTVLVRVKAPTLINTDVEHWSLPPHALDQPVSIVFTCASHLKGRQARPSSGIQQWAGIFVSGCCRVFAHPSLLRL